VRSELGQDSGDMMFNRPGAGRKPLGDLDIAQALGEERQNL
jgi:hypothetical protein